MVYKDRDTAFKNRSPADSITKKSTVADFTDLILLSGVLLVTLLFIYSPYINDGIVRFGLALATVLFVPGYMLIAAIYPGKDSLGNMERLLLSFTFSIILVPMACFVLNYTAWGITLNSAVAVITLLTGTFTAAAFLRRLELPGDQRLSLNMEWLYGDVRKILLPSSKSATDTLIAAVLLLSIISVAAVTAYSAIGHRPEDRYTELFLCDANGKLGNYTTALSPGQNGSIVVGISNFEGADRVYDLVVNFDDGKAPFDIYREQIPVPDNQTVKRTLFLTPKKPYETARVTFSLYDGQDSQTPYRQCYLLLNGTAQKSGGPTIDETALSVRNKWLREF